MDSERAERISITVPSELRYGEAVRSLLNTLSKRLEEETATKELNTHIVSAFNEAFTNIVEHAYLGSGCGEVTIEVVLTPTEIIISLVDYGKGYDVAAVDAPDLGTLPESGLGLLIIRSFMSQVEYERQKTRNVLKMTKAFSKPLLLGEGAPEVFSR